MQHALLVFAACLLAAAPARAVKLSADEDTFVNVRFLLQAWVQVTEEGAPNGESLGKDLFLRRVRIILGGQINDRISFFFNTDAPNFGRDGYENQAFLVHDAWATYRIAPELLIDAGFMQLPSVHNGNLGAPFLFTLDYHAPVFRFPPASTQFFRDMGVQARGVLADDRVQYRLGVFRGVRGVPTVAGAPPTGPQGLNPSDALRLAGSLRFNFLEAEREEFFLKGLYFGEKSVLSVGVAGEWQEDAARDAAGLTDYGWGGADVFLDLPIGAQQEVIANVAAMSWQAGEGSPNTGMSYYAEAGYRYREVSPFVAWESFDSDAPQGAGDFDAIRFGGAWWIDQQNANLKLEVSRITPKAGATDPEESQWLGVLQAQLFL